MSPPFLKTAFFFFWCRARFCQHKHLPVILVSFVFLKKSQTDLLHFPI
ncbi:rCG43913 [Rattus norvegicus]|uniref:RCG43913 n=1 Tax=Rattus norvegicus TaxID=10116 RepID=A6J6R3_RAT|nr:rCG43913 [Rattus norvegicus]